jgi:hypothetical protein
MTGEQPSTGLTSREQALDAALGRALRAPALPPGFRAQVTAAIARAGATAGAARARLEREQRERLAEFEAGYVRLRVRTLVALVGGAAVAGGAVALATPWFQATFGANAPIALASAGALAGLGIGALAWLRKQGYADLL